MTVSSTSTYEFNVADIVKMGYQMAGLSSAYQALTTQQAQMGMDLLDLISRSTQTMGLFAKVGELYDLYLVANIRNYTLPGTILDVDGDGAFVPSGQPLTAAAGETPVRPISREKWQGISAHNATGRPVEYFSDRSDAAVVVYVWPTPDASNLGVIRLQTHRLRSNMREGAATIDFEPFWQEYFVCELGARLALAHSLNLSRVQFLKAEAQEKLERCRAQSHQRGAQQFVIRHRVGFG